eukprot:comp19453_c0_seq1/m.22614 comp19453_c0_seq1/g.22614  ORF comp19453_c0_seq1/g.22614 comp19453_c0_seq1/m.22614 type:complete len:370 (-) comp19453_c0_seq1:329-1438(-)
MLSSALSLVARFRPSLSLALRSASPAPAILGSKLAKHVFGTWLPTHAYFGAAPLSSAASLRQARVTAPRHEQQKTVDPPSVQPLHFACASAGKGKPREPSKDGKKEGFDSLPSDPVTNGHEMRKRDYGEDAFFLYDGDTHLVFGVADGVGGWVEHGVDPSLFAWALMDNAEKVAKKSGGGSLPGEILELAYDAVVLENKVKAGSSTACIVTVDKRTGVLNGANLGDSGMVLLRKGRTAWHSPEQQHFFNAPFQLAVMPENMRSGSIIDRPGDAYSFQATLQKGDVVLVGTDGLYDNMFDHEIENELKPFLAAPGGFNTREAVAKLVARATVLAKDEERVSPFASHARKYGYNFKGGKVDDVCAVIAYVD